MLTLLPLTAALVSILIAPGLLFYFDVTPKILVLLSTTSIALVFVRENFRRLTVLFKDRIGRWLIILAAAQELSLIASTILSRNPAVSLNGGNWRRFGLITQSSLLIFIILAAAWLLTDSRCLRRLLRAISISGTLIALYAVLQYFGIDPLQPASAYRIGEGEWTIVRPPGTLGHADYLGAYLLYAVFAGVALILIEDIRYWKWLGAGAAISAVFGIVISGTRGSLLGLAAGIGVVLLLLRPKLRLAPIAVAICVLFGIGGFYLSPAGQRLRARTRWYVEDPRGGARLWLWRDSARMGVERMAFGYGPETFTTEFPHFQSLDLARAYPDFYHESPHNIFLDAFTAQGLPGVLVLAGSCGLAFLAVRRARIQQPGLSAALTGAWVAALLNQQFVCFILPTALLFYLTIGMLASVRTAPSVHVESRGAARVLMPFAITLAAVLILYGARLARADYAMANVQRDLDAGNLDRAIAGYQGAGYGSALFYSRRMALFARNSNKILERLRASQQATVAAADAVREADDRQNAYYNAAEVSALNNDAAGVEQNLRAAISAAPNWFKPHWVLAQFLAQRGKLDEAETEAGYAVERDGGKNPEVTRTLDDIRRMHQAKQLR